jgi:hypothetical protein
MTSPALERKVATLEKAVLHLRFQYERDAVSAAPAKAAPVTLTPKEFGRRIGRSAGWVRREIFNRTIKAFGPPYIIPASELAKFI